MADDTRQPKSSPEDLSRAALTVSPENKPFTGTQWQNGKAVGPYTAPPPESANILAGGTEHTAGGKAPEVTLANAVKDLGWKDFSELPKRPCVRDALLTGIGSGFAFGGVKTIFGAVWTSCSYAVFSFCFGSVGMYQYCLYRRQAEKDGMMRVIDVMNKKDIERKAREQRKERVKQERRLNKDEELDGRIAAMGGKREGAPAVGGDGGGGDGGGGGRPWWKVW
ncbi:hypothetical protein LTR22_025896 [Elasticomyces elasticus]|nr:hypothetical protein LTR22_025896 [Elasticomyces elasticus]KAK4926629.1 hypothetical protein LTR49_006563 [Elasticomyces elasticus]KAK5739497.1 hypothetical protein LTS12_025251 [Elasticomyces elasticus]